MEYLLFVTYLVLFAWLVTKIKIFAGTGISRWQLIIIFLLKVMAGIFYGWMGIYYGGLAQMSDTWTFHGFGLYEYHLLGNRPQEYFTNLFHNPYPAGFSNFFASSDSYWNDLKSNVFIKFLSLLDIFSFGHYYVNIIFYAFITLFGPVALYRVMTDIYPKAKRSIFVAVFMIPSFLYWTSGLHKEGLVFMAIAFIIYVIYFYNKDKRMTARRWQMLLVSLLLLLVLRNFIFAMLVPACLAWLLANRWPERRRSIFPAVYLAFIVIFFTARYISPALDLPQVVVNKQESFLNVLEGRTNVTINRIEPTFKSFVQNTPQAILLSMARPYPSDVIHLPSMAACTEISLVLMLFILFIVFHRKHAGPTNNVIYFCIFFSLSMMLAIGFSNNNLGAICRYRSIVLPLLCAPMVAAVDWSRLLNLFTGEGKK